MKTYHLGAIVIFAMFLSLVPQQSIAQEEKKPVNVRKELKQVLKELPADLQMEVLRYAQRQKAVNHAASIKKEELTKNAKAVKANPKAKAMPAQAAEAEKMAERAPKKAKELKVNPAAAPAARAVTPASAASTPQAPMQPEYMRLAETMPQTSIEWMEESFDFGEVQEGEKPTHIYKFRNTGTNPLKITRVKPSCGCTTPGWSKEEIAPGEEGYVEVSYNSKNRPGMANKSITVTGNFEQRNKVLRFKVNVIKAE